MTERPNPSRSRSRTTLALLFALASGLAAPAARADDKQIAAEALFQEAKKLIEAGRFGEACPKLEESNRLAPAVGVLMNLGACYERTGRVASAWAALNEAADRSRAAGDAQRERLARERALALEPRLPKAIVEIKAPVQGIVVERDGNPMTPGMLGQALPIDPGDHVFVARAPGYRDWSTRVAFAEGKQTTVTIDAMTALPKSEAHASKKKAVSSGSSLALGLVVGAVGIVGVGVGAATGAAAMSKMTDAKSKCTGADQKTGCGADALALQDGARPLATVSTIGFVAGGVALAAGATILVLSTGSSDDGTSTALAVSPRGVSLARSW